MYNGTHDEDLENPVPVCKYPYLLCLILLLLFKDVSEVNELLHGFDLPAEMFKVHATSPAVSL